ncbi:MAG: LysR substrate-binding domain-containing protein [Acidimicrobiia bacterium]|nr:LysR substrate-binding domain-containing protein [Acidimicrobiia bacterium]
MNLQRLRYFLAVADELHFGRAAERLHMAQPPLSQQIRLLETELSVKLFDRTTRRVALTAAGEVFRIEAERVIVAADSADRVMEEFRSGEGGLLRLAFVDSASFEVMPRYLRAFRQRWPKVKHDLQIMSSSRQVDALHAGDIDLAISRTSPPDGDLVSNRFLAEPLYLVVGPDHPSHGDETVAIRDIDASLLIGFDRRLSPTLHEELQRLFEEADSRYDPEIEATEYTTILGLVSSGEGSAIVPDGVRTFQPEGTHYIAITDVGASMAMYLNRRADEPLRVVAQAELVIQELFSSRHSRSRSG